jgi:hypothetical protein
MENTAPDSWARAAVERLLAKCLREVAARLQRDSEAVLMEMLRRGRL